MLSMAENQAATWGLNPHQTLEDLEATVCPQWTEALDDWVDICVLCMYVVQRVGDTKTHRN